MSKYTTELRYICENYAGLDESCGYNDESVVIAKARTKLFDFEYPIYDEAYKSVLETKIIKHYYFNEIGFETVGMFKHYLNARMNEIMPYYNQLYRSELLEFNPLYDVDLTTDHTRGTEGSNKGTGTTESAGTDKYTRNLKDSEETAENGTNWAYNNDTPQGGIDGLDSLDYLTSATKQTNNDGTNRTLEQTGNDERNATNTGSTTTTTEYKDTEDYLEHVKGKTGGSSYSTRLKEYRETFLNIDAEIIDRLSDLFMLLW